MPAFLGYKNCLVMSNPAAKDCVAMSLRIVPRRYAPGIIPLTLRTSSRLVGTRSQQVSLSEAIS